MGLNTSLLSEPGGTLPLGRAVIFDRLAAAQHGKIAVPTAHYRGVRQDIGAPSANADPTETATDADPLTGLPTRHHFLDHLAQCLQPGSPDANRSALLVLELDSFKTVNDAMGLATGDKLLARIAARICLKVPHASIVARTSGNGFAVLLPDRGTASAAAETLLEFVSRPVALDGQIVTVTASIGVAVTATDGADAPAIYQAAELAMHQAQSDQQNCVRYFEPIMRERAMRRQSLETDLRSAIASHDVAPLRVLHPQQFAVLYQPKVNFSTGCVTGFEALLRWRHPELGFVSPDHFIPMAEETGLIDIIGEWALHTACQDAACWPVPDDGVPLTVAVNVSPLQLRDGATLVATIEQALAGAGLEPGRLEIELTESALVGDIGDTLAAIRALGIGIALDDFGTGHSSLSRLHLFPFTRLKIDRSFVVALGQGDDPEARRASEMMLRAIVALGNSLGLDTIVEGVETMAQAEIASRTGCTEMQGYFASPAVASAAVPALLARTALLPSATANPDGR